MTSPHCPLGENHVVGPVILLFKLQTLNQIAANRRDSVAAASKLVHPALRERKRGCRDFVFFGGRKAFFHQGDHRLNQSLLLLP